MVCGWLPLAAAGAQVCVCHRPAAQGVSGGGTGGQGGQGGRERSTGAAALVYAHASPAAPRSPTAAVSSCARQRWRAGRQRCCNARACGIQMGGHPVCCIAKSWDTWVLLYWQLPERMKRTVPLRRPTGKISLRFMVDAFINKGAFFNAVGCSLGFPCVCCCAGCIVARRDLFPAGHLVGAGK